MRFGDICKTKKLDAKGENADLKMNIINEIHNQINVSLIIMLHNLFTLDHDNLRKVFKLMHPMPKAPCMKTLH